MKIKFKNYLFIFCTLTVSCFLAYYPYLKQINDPPPLYGVVVDFHNNRLSYDIIKSNYSQLSEKGYDVKAEDGFVTIRKNDLEINLNLNKEIDRERKPKVRYVHNAGFIFDVVEYKYYADGLTIEIAYKTTIFSKKPVVLSQLYDLYNDLQVQSVDDSFKNDIGNF